MPIDPTLATERRACSDLICTTHKTQVVRCRIARSSWKGRMTRAGPESNDANDSLTAMISAH
eukprot:3398045-Amphidinium_carterae.3